MTETESSERSKSGAAKCLCVLGKCIGCRQVHACIHWLWKPVKIIAFLIFFLWAFGLPGGWVANKLQPYLEPYTISIQRVTWSPLRGLILHNPEINEPEFGSIPILTADSFFIRPFYGKWLEKKWETRNIGIKNGRILFPVSHTNSGITIVDYMDLHDVEGNLDCDGVLTRVQLTATSDIGAACRIAGTFKQKSVDDSKGTIAWVRQIHSAHASLYTTPHWIVAVRERIDEMLFDEQPEVSISFKPDGTSHESSEYSIAFSAGSFQYRSVEYDRMLVDVHFKDNQFDIERAQLERGEHMCKLTGSYKRSDDEFEAHALNDLPMDTLSVFFPDTWQEKMTKTGCQFSGTLESEAWIGPCGIRKVPENWGGWLSLDNAAAGELEIAQAFASIKREPNLFIINDAQIVGADGKSTGTISFNTKTDIENKVTQGDIDLGIDLKPLRPFLPKGLKRLANELDIRDQPARFKGTFTIPHTNTQAAVINGAAFGTNLSYRGVILTDFSTGVSHYDGILQLDDFHALCQTGSVDGTFVFDLPAKIYGLDLAITADPGRVGPAAGIEFAKAIKPFAFSDDIFLDVEGVVHPLAMEETELQVYLSGENIGRTNLVADHLQASANLFNNLLSITNLSAQIFGGTVTGILSVKYSDSSTNFNFSGSATNLVVDRIAKTFRPAHTNIYEGIVDGRIHVQGPFPDRPSRHNITGEGHFLVRDGRLMRISIFGGLSKLLSKIYPGLGFAEQNQLKGNFHIRDGAIRTKDTILLGSVLSFSAKGKMSFSNNLDFDIQVKPLRSGIIASTIRLVTIPLTKLLEFNVKGPISDPKWEAKNIPLL